MEKLGLACPFFFLTGKPQGSSCGILQLNYDCYLEIFTYLTTLEDLLNLGRAHPLLCDVLGHVLRTRYKKINVRMLKTISDWEFLLGLCGSDVIRCELPHGHWDDGITYPFLNLLGRLCPNLRQVVVIFMHTVTPLHTTEDVPSSVMPLLLELPGLTNLTLIDAKASHLEQLQYFSKLQSLDLDGIDNSLSVSAFETMFHNKDQLRSLLLNFGRGFRQSFQLLQVAKKCPRLNHITLENVDSRIRDLGTFRNLQSLHLIFSRIVEINTDFYRTLVKQYAGRLQRLHLTSVRVRVDQVHHFRSLNGLKSFDCDHYPIQSLDELCHLTSLECLALDCLEPLPNASRQLLDILKECSNLKHLKLGVRWQMSIEDSERLVGSYGNTNEDPRRKLLLSLTSVENADIQEKLKNLVRDPEVLQLSFKETTCHHCHRDTHSKCDTIFT
ncbi:hypothetical protein KR074_008993 [Drosophila pseudoananassae]|nr:hypothetical protein KR074_008993 [Drosophila pseudoananassae]